MVLWPLTEGCINDLNAHVYLLSDNLYFYLGPLNQIKQNSIKTAHASPIWLYDYGNRMVQPPRMGTFTNEVETAEDK